MLALRKALPKLNAADRATALDLLGITAAAPCNGDTTHPYQTVSDPEGFFEIHYTTSGPNKVTDPTYLTRVAATLDTVYDTEIAAMGYQPPLTPAVDASGWWSGGSQIPIELCNIAPDLYGYCAAVGTSVTDAFPAACTLRNSYANQTVNGVTYAYYDPSLDGSDTDAPLKVTAAHEFFHAVQFRQDANEPLWLMEGTAVWMENEVYPAIHDYLQYLPFSGISQPRFPFDYTGGYAGDYIPYGDFALFKTISGYLGGPGAIKEIWNYLGRHQGVSALDALKYVAARHNRSLVSVMLTYAIWNTLPLNSYPDARLYGPVGWWLRRTLDRGNRVLKGTRVAIYPLADAPVVITRGSRVLSTTGLQIGVSGPRGAAGGWFTVRRQLTTGSTSVSQYQIGAKGSVVTIPFNSSVRSVVITLDNVATSGSPTYFGVRATVL